MRGTVFAPGGFRSAARGGLRAGWRRAERLRGSELPARQEASPDRLPLDSGENSATLNVVDASVAPEQPPSTPDNPASRPLSLGLSATGILSYSPTLSLSAQAASVTISGCGVTPPGLTY